MSGEQPPREPRWWENLLLGTPVARVPSLVPEVGLAAGVVAVSVALADWINGAWGYDGLVSFILVAIVIGMVIRNTIGPHEVFTPGIGFSLKKLLRLGIILLGIRLSLLDVLEVGAYGIPVVVGAVATGLLVSTAATRWLCLSDRLGTLIAVGTGMVKNTSVRDGCGNQRKAYLYEKKPRSQVDPRLRSDAACGRLYG